MLALTQKQIDILDYIKSYQFLHGAGPSHNTMAQHFGWKSKTAVICHLNAIQAKGFITRTPGKVGHIRVLKSVQHEEPMQATKAA